MSHLAELSKKVEESEKEIAHLRLTVDGLIRKIDNLENRSRQNNLVIRGIKEEHDETEVTLKHHVVKGVFEEKLGASATTVYRIHRIGKSYPNY